MASTLTAAFELAAGPELDLAAGFAKEPYRAAEVDNEIEEAFAEFDGSAWRKMAEHLASAWRVHVMDAEDAITDALLKMWEDRPEVVTGEAPDAWCGLLYTYAANILRARVSERVKAVPFSELERLGGGDDDYLDQYDWLNVRPVVAYTKAGVDEDARFVDPPKGPKEAWTWTQAIGAAQRFRDRHGRSPRASDFKRNEANGLPARAVLCRLGFAGIGDYHLQAGLPVEARPRRRNSTPREAAEECVKFREREGRWPSIADLKHHAERLPPNKAFVRFFGGSTAHHVQRGSEEIMNGELPRHRRNWLPAAVRRKLGAEASLKSVGYPRTVQAT
jgi:DNA-directed RNA polymerase specialized sigma24 family protein